MAVSAAAPTEISCAGKRKRPPKKECPPVVFAGNKKSLSFRCVVLSDFVGGTLEPERRSQLGWLSDEISDVLGEGLLVGGGSPAVRSGVRKGVWGRDASRGGACFKQRDGP